MKTKPIEGRGNALLPHLKFLMRLLILLCCTTVFSLTPKGLFSQNNKINIDSDKEITVDEVFELISRQTKYTFMYPADMFSKFPKVQLRKGSMPMDELVNQSLANSNMSAVMTEYNTIIIRETNPLDQRSISGKVTDNEGVPIGGVTVRIKNTSLGTTTDFDGYYSIEVSDNNPVLVFSSIGFVTKEYQVKNVSTINIVLDEGVTQLDEVVLNGGYYTTSKRKNTGSISKVETKQITEQPTSDPVQALQGRVPGLFLSQPNGNIPGGALQIRIRGVNSIAAGNDPLIIVDGIPYPSQPIDPESNITSSFNSATSPFNSLNPEDIQSIDVLKDSDATAIYGSRGANGVILITTKRGLEGSPKLNVNIYSGIGRVSRRIDFVSLNQYLEMRRDAFAFDGIAPTPQNAPDLLLWPQTQGNDFQDILFGGTSQIINSNVNYSGGNAQTQFALSGGFRDEGNVHGRKDLGLTKGTVRLALDHTSKNNKIKMGSSLSYAIEQNNFLPQVDLNMVFYTPNTPLYNEDGSYYFDLMPNNPEAYRQYTSKNHTKNFTGNFNISMELMDGLDLSTSLGYVSIFSRKNVIVPSYAANPTSADANGYGLFGDGNVENFIVEPKLTYSRFFGKLKVDALVGGTYQNNVSTNELVSGRNFPSDDLLESKASAGNLQALFSNKIEYKYASLYSRLGFDFDNKYLFNATFRRDASSRFGPGKRTGNFYALGAGWIFGETELLKDSEVLSFGKIRASYGITGNDQIRDYGYLSIYSGAGSYFDSAFIPTSVANPNYSWEENKKLEFGLELGFLDNRIELTTNYFRNRSSNQLVGQPLPGQTGFRSFQANLPALVQNEGWEFELSTEIVRTEHFNWQTSLNVTSFKNELLEYPGLESSVYANAYEIGEPLTVIQGYKFNGVDPDTGYAIIEDVDGDGTISSPADFQPLGNYVPNLYGGLYNQFQYKNFHFNFLFQFEKGAKKDIYYYGGLFGTPYVLNPIQDMYDYWRQPGDAASYPILTTTFGESYANSTNGAIYSQLSSATDADFIRLKTLYVGYDIENSTFRKWGVQNFTVYVSGQNLLTFTNYKGLDPESGKQGLPPLQIISVGFKFQL